MAKSSEEKNREYAKQYDQIRGRKQNESRRQSRYNSSSKSNNGSSTCFPSGTMILTPHGERDIAVLSPGDLVVSNENGVLRVQRVLDRPLHKGVRLWIVTFADGTTVRTTRAHSFLTATGWKRAEKLIAHDSVFVVRKGALSRESVFRSYASTEVEDVYNLIVENDYTFVADGAVVHSFSYARGLRSLLSRMVRYRAKVARLSPFGEHRPWSELAGN